MLCMQRGIKLYIIQGYDMGLSKYNIYDDYRADETYKLHDNTENNTVPCRQFQTKLAQKINNEFLKMDLPLERFIG